MNDIMVKSLEVANRALMGLPEHLYNQRKAERTPEEFEEFMDAISKRAERYQAVLDRRAS